MRKQVLVSVDRGETRVAILESKKAAGRQGRSEQRSKGVPKVDQDWRVARALHRAPRPPLDRRQRLQGPRRQRARRDGGRVRRHRPREERLPARRRDRHARRQDAAAAAAASGGGPRISDLLKAGQEIVVQVTKDPIGTKGARLTMEVSIPGRYLVYVPDGDGVGVSRRLPDKERERLRKLASGLKLEQGGLIIRTAAHGARKSDMERELQYLLPAPRGARRAASRSRARRRWCSRRPTCRSGSCATSTRASSSAR